MSFLAMPMLRFRELLILGFSPVIQPTQETKTPQPLQGRLARHHHLARLSTRTQKGTFSIGFRGRLERADRGIDHGLVALWLASLCIGAVETRSGPLCDELHPGTGRAKMNFVRNPFSFPDAIPNVGGVDHAPPTPCPRPAHASARVPACVEATGRPTTNDRMASWPAGWCANISAFFRARS